MLKIPLARVQQISRKKVEKPIGSHMFLSGDEADAFSLGLLNVKRIRRGI